MHRLQSMSREMIHLGVHNHPVVDGKCWELVEETRRLVIEEVDRMLDVKISSISLNVSKTLASYLLDDSNDDTMELFKVNNWSTSKTSFVNLTFLTFVTLLFFSRVI